MEGNNAKEPATGSLDPPTIRNLIEKNVGLLERKCIRLNGRDPSWRALFSEQLHDITRAGSPAEFESRMNAVIARGGLSHVEFFHETGRRAPARYAIDATFCPVNTPQGSRWFFQDVHEAGPAHVAGIRPGDMLLDVNGTPFQPPELPTFALGTDASVTVEGADGGLRQVQIALPKAAPGKRDAKPPMAEPKSVTSREIKPGVGYVRIAFFPGVNGQRFARELDSALAEMPDCERLIVDLAAISEGSSGRSGS